ncbi:uncharacterized protein FIBRA_01719 [Fibroporia radiculosa]|uniref:Caspase family p20 domain-containing protein n=1 Tax=Fibroporia radiculosa TaxID=599839 RepID=J4G152_9APHY|nr:uncharacterized protein FIBRA_01719 [Fibroporia radiculosa]CCL99698.1 predicted protein [Fibroporia radiculosa]
MATRLSGVFTITNAFHSNRVAMLNDNDAEPLFCVVPLLEVSKAELWTLIPSTAGRHQLRNMGFESRGFPRPSYGVDPQVVVGSSSECWWFIERVAGARSKPDTYFIRHNERRELCWRLDDGSPKTPIELLDDPGHPRNIWQIVPHVDFDSDSNTSSPSQMPLVDSNPVVDATIDHNASVLPAMDILKCLSETTRVHLPHHLELLNQLTDATGAVPSPKMQPRLFALIIGIDKHKATSITNLSGAARDADTVRDYLQEQLGVPSFQIRNLRDGQATRAAILRGIHGFLDDERIRKGDPILIYYAGHCATSVAPTDWDTAGAEIQLLVPYDQSDNGQKGCKVHGIPNRTLGALLVRLAANKGDNICVVLDCCHSGAGTREHGGESAHVYGRIEVEAIPSDLDEDLWNSLQPEERETAAATSFSYDDTGFRCHVLLASPSAEDPARETSESGLFTRTPIDAPVKDEAHGLKYTGVVQRMARLPAEVQSFRADKVRDISIVEPRRALCAESEKSDTVSVNDVVHGKTQREKQRRVEEREIYTPVLNQSVDIADMVRSISIRDDEVKSTPESNLDKCSHLDNLGHKFFSRFERLGNIEDIYRSISIHEEAVQLSPDDDPGKPIRLNRLGCSLLCRFERLDNIEDIHRSISIHEDAVQLSPSGDPGKPTRLNSLGCSLLCRFERLGNLRDIHRSISMHEDAVQLSLNGDHEKLTRLNSLGLSLFARFSRLDNLKDIHRSILMHEDVIQLSLDSDPDKPSRLNHLGYLFLTRFKRLGNLKDIHRSISLREHAVQLCLNSHPKKPHFLKKLGVSLFVRFEELGNLKDIHYSISMLEDAVRLSPDSDCDKPSRLNYLEYLLFNRFKRLGNPADIHSSISMHKHALQLSPGKSAYLDDLNRSLSIRSKRLGRPRK